MMRETTQPFCASFLFVGWVWNLRIAAWEYNGVCVCHFVKASGIFELFSGLGGGIGGRILAPFRIVLNSISLLNQVVSNPDAVHHILAA